MQKIINPLVPQAVIDIETWMNIPDYENYQGSSWGSIRNKKTGRIRKLGWHEDGYLLVALHKDGSRKTFAVSRIIASLFVPNPLKLPEVNHLDLIKSNNFANNLEWDTHKENMRHAYRNRHIERKGTVTEKHKAVMALMRKKVYAYDPVTKDILEFNGHALCAYHFGVLSSTISSTIITGSRLRRKYNLFHETAWQQFKTVNNL